MTPDLEKLPPEDRMAFRAISGAIQEGNPSGTLKPIPKDEADARTALCMLSIGQAKLKMTFDLGEKIDLLLRPGVRATIEFRGKFGREDIEKLKRHLDLLAESLDSVSDD